MFYFFAFVAFIATAGAVAPRVNDFFNPAVLAGWAVLFSLLAIREAIREAVKDKDKA